MQWKWSCLDVKKHAIQIILIFCPWGVVYHSPFKKFPKTLQRGYLITLLWATELSSAEWKSIALCYFLIFVLIIHSTDWHWWFPLVGVYICILSFSNMRAHTHYCYLAPHSQGSHFLQIARCMWIFWWSNYLFLRSSAILPPACLLQKIAVDGN